MMIIIITTRELWFATTSALGKLGKGIIQTPHRVIRESRWGISTRMERERGSIYILVLQDRESSFTHIKPQFLLHHLNRFLLMK